MSPFANEHILITGAGSGIGRALAIRLSAEGAAVGGIDRVADGLAGLAKELDGRPFAWATADVTERVALTTAVREVEGRLGPTDRLVACAGVGRGTVAHPFSSADFEEVVRINLIGVANAIETVLPGMIERRKGHLVGLSSLASFRGLPKMSAYCASKAGVNALFDSLAIELKPHNVRVTTVCPGFIRTPMTAAFDHEFPDMMELDDAIGRILAAIRQKKRFVAFPAKRAGMLRFLRWLPTTWADRVLERQFERMIGDADLTRR
jgi:NAD(P)-dependent dehydrogenase (short-subunit alcohol dehydrogenase family)